MLKNQIWLKCYPILTTLLYLLLLLSHNNMNAQEPLDPIFISQVENLLKAKPKNYHDIDFLLKPVSNDTIKMRYLSVKEKNVSVSEPFNI